MRSLLAVVIGATLLAPRPVADAVDPLVTVASRLCATPSPAADADKTRPVLLDGFGGGGFAVDATPDAQRWFDQGVATAFAFSHRETERAFEEAQRLDPACGMCAWGEAYAIGPTINFGVDAAKRKEALTALDRAEAAGQDLAAKHRAMIAALKARYADPDKADRGPADRAYAVAMEKLAAEHPGDDALSVLAAEAMMIAGPGVGDGPGAKSADAAPALTSERRAAALLERVMARSPDHTGAIHYYIHLTEWMGEAHKALRGADKLGRLAPAAGHLVHMPSHTFIRVGRYADAASVNAAAAKADAALAARTGLENASKVSYHAHNLHFRTIAAITSGDRKSALEGADAFLAAYPVAEVKPGFAEAMAASSFFAYGRYADAARIAAIPEPAANRPILRGARAYALGEAALRAGDSAEAGRQIEALRQLGKSLPASKGEAGMPRQFVDMARWVLEGRRHAGERRWSAAARSFERAAAVQGKLGVDGDPPLFWFDIRRAHALALLESGKRDEARTLVFRSLKDWPSDPMTLLVLAEIERRADRPSLAASAEAAARRAWTGAPAELTLAGV